MKRLAAIVAGFFVITIVLSFFTPPADAQSAGEPRTYGQWSTTTVAATPVRLYPTNLWVASATVFGLKAARTTNTSLAYLGVTSANDSQPIVLTLGGQVVIEGNNGTLVNLYDWYVDVGSDNDGCFVIYH